MNADVAPLVPPGRLNVALAIAAYAAAASLLWLASHAQSTWVAAAAAVGFALVGGTIFSLLHESVHGLFHLRRSVNDAFGVLSAAWFPTSFTFQRACHLGHHRRNRTDEELFDYYLPGESRLLKAYRLYSLLTGFYWLSVPTGCLALVLAPRWFLGDTFRRRVAAPMGFGPMVRGFRAAPLARIRREAAVTLLVQGLLVGGLGLSLAGWSACYAAFALNWCALQYTDHAWTKRDIRDGAWNLRTARVIRYVHLNYHHHLAHHQHPTVPWVHLHRYVDPRTERPSFLRTYLSLWGGPRPVVEPAPRSIDPALERELGV